MLVIKNGANFYNKGAVIGIQSTMPVNDLTNVYTVEVKFMRGDADSYSTQVVEFGVGEEAKMYAFLTFLCRCASKYQRGKGGCDSYATVPGYLYWVFAELDGETWYGYEANDQPVADCPIMLDLNARFGHFENAPAVLDWPMEEGEYWDSFEEAQAFWYDELGIKHQIDLELG